MTDALAIAVVLVVGITIGYWLRAADLAAWARQSAERDLKRRGLTLAADPLTEADYAWLRECGIAYDPRETTR